MKKKRDSSNDSLSLFFGLINLDSWSKSQRILFLNICVIVIYVAYFVLNELLFKSMEFSYVNSYVFFQYLFLAFFSSLEAKYENQLPSSVLPLSSSPSPPSSLSSSRCPKVLFFFLSLLTISPSIFNYLSLLYLPMPLWVMVKSLRIVWVLIIGVSFFRKSYPWKSYLSSFFITLGIILFSFGYSSSPSSSSSSFATTIHKVATECPLDGHEKDPLPSNVSNTLPLSSSFSLLSSLSPTALSFLYGILLSCASLFLSAFKSNLQERIIRKYDLPHTETIYFSHLYGAYLLFPYLIITGELISSLSLISSSLFVLGNILISFCLHYTGVVVVLNLTKISGALSVSLVASSRKMLTVLLSCVIFDQPFPLPCFFGSLMVFGGILFSTLSTDAKKMKFMEVDMIST